jgi:hypothetical protein
LLFWLALTDRWLLIGQPPRENEIRGGVHAHLSACEGSRD